MTDLDQARRAAAAAGTAAYWTPERRAQQWAHVVANSAAVDVGSAMRREIERIQHEIVNVERAVYEAAFAALMSSPAFEAKVAAKRAMLEERAKMVVDA